MRKPSNCVKISIAAMSAILLAACGQAPEQPKKPPPLVKTFTVSSDMDAIKRSYPGRVLANKRVDLSFQVNGQIINKPAIEGMVVTKDQLLANLDPRDFQNTYNSEKARLDKARLDLLRATELLRSGTIARSDYDKTRESYDVAKSKTDIARKALEDSKLTAPFDGLVARTYVDNFQDVQAKQKILSLQDISNIDILIDVPERDLIMKHRRKQEKIERDKDWKSIPIGVVKFNAIPGDKYPVTVKEYKTEADPITQTYQVTLTMPAPKAKTILPGMTATFVATVPDEELIGSYFVPSHAVTVDKQGKHYVWMIDTKTTTVHKKSVRAGHMIGNKIEITSGVKTGDMLVVAGQPFLEEGMKVRLQTKGP